MQNVALAANEDDMQNDIEKMDHKEPKDVGGVSGSRLKAYLDRIERLEEEKKALAEDIKDIYAEAKSFGFDTKTMRKVLKIRNMDDNKRREEDELLELYASAVGIAL
jgi:uncharacterized protein (UPF0335 family)